MKAESVCQLVPPGVRTGLGLQRWSVYVACSTPLGNVSSTGGTGTMVPLLASAGVPSTPAPAMLHTQYFQDSEVWGVLSTADVTWLIPSDALERPYTVGAGGGGPPLDPFPPPPPLPKKKIASAPSAPFNFFGPPSAGTRGTLGGGGSQPNPPARRLLQTPPSPPSHTSLLTPVHGTARCCTQGPQGRGVADRLVLTFRGAQGRRMACNQQFPTRPTGLWRPRATRTPAPGSGSLISLYYLPIALFHLMTLVYVCHIPELLDIQYIPFKCIPAYSLRTIAGAIFPFVESGQLYAYGVPCIASAQRHTPAHTSQCRSRHTPLGLGVCIWMLQVNGTGNGPVSGTTPGVVKQDKSSGGSVDTTRTRGERPIGTAKGKQPNTEALCPPPPRQPPGPVVQSPHHLCWRAPSKPHGLGMTACEACQRWRGSGHQGAEGCKDEQWDRRSTLTHNCIPAPPPLPGGE